MKSKADIKIVTGNRYIDTAIDMLLNLEDEDSKYRAYGWVRAVWLNDGKKPTGKKEDAA